MTTRAFLVALLGGLAAAGCSGHEGPVAGELEVRLATPNADDRAIIFRLVGPQTAVTPPSGAGYRVFTTPGLGDTARVVVVAPQGTRLAAGALARVGVPDTRQVEAYVAVVQEVASASYATRGGTGYVLTVVKP